MLNPNPEDIQAVEVVVKTFKNKQTKKSYKGTPKDILKGTNFYQKCQYDEKYKEGLYKVKVNNTWTIIRHFKEPS